MQQTPFWLTKSSLGYENGRKYPTLTSKISADICIVGCGIVGTFLAYWLTELGVSVVVLEKDLIASAASGRNTGFVFPGTVEHFNRAVTMYGSEKASKIWRFTENNYSQIREIIHDENIDCQMIENGSLIVAGSNQEDVELKESASLLNQNGFQAEWWPKLDVEGKLGTGKLFGAMRSQIGAGVQPAKLVHELSFVNQKKRSFPF